MASKKRTDNKGRNLRNNELQRPDGRYLYRYKAPDDKIKVVYARTLAELREKEAAIQKDLLDGINTAGNRKTLNQLFYTDFMEIKKNLRPSTKDNYLRTWKNYIPDSLAAMKVTSIKVSHIKKLYAELEAKGLAKSTIKLVHNILSPCLQIAVDDHIIRENPAVKVKYNGPKKERSAITADQQERLLDFCRNSNTYCDRYPLLMFALATGLRVGELTGLTWQDIDMRNGIIHITHQLQYLKSGTDKTHFFMSPLKTEAGIRDIPLNKTMRKALNEQKKLALMQGRTGTVTIDGFTDFLFTSKSGMPYATNAINSFLKNIVEAYNKKELATAEAERREPRILPHISAHILRHSCCTRMAEAGVSLKTTQKTMGHKSAKITMDIYTHVGNLAQQQEELKKMDEAPGFV